MSTIPDLKPKTRSSAYALMRETTKHKRDLDFPKSLSNLALAHQLSFRIFVDHELADGEVILKISGGEIIIKAYMKTSDGRKRPTFDSTETEEG